MSARLQEVADQLPVASLLLELQTIRNRVCSSREETNYWREVGMGEGWWVE